MEFNDVIKGRRSIRKFKDTAIEEEKIKKLIDIIKYVPTGHNLQDYFVYVVKNPEVKQKLAEAAMAQSFVAQAPLVFVVCSEPEKEGTERSELFATQGSAMATYAITLEAYELVLGSVWIGSFEKEKVRQILEIPKKYRPIAIVAVGYPDEDPKMPPRRDDYFKIIE